eukprot:gnl/Chilomastix_caulleri/4539.p2 GENE.gnl/Chilomastix_caulleri/4539~~gnl/Chilomastix_caulleri/4539.p2  ORF type:complete len:53 (+),score=2.99 gnl/Chilomastix_caulleri/4539:74-232(+)
MEDKKKIEVPEEAKFRIILSSSEKDQINESKYIYNLAQTNENQITVMMDKYF